MSKEIQNQLTAQNYKPDYGPPSVEESYYGGILRRLEMANLMHPAGSHDHQVVLSSALMGEWPTIKLLLLEKAYGRAWWVKKPPPSDGVPTKGG